MCGSPPSQSSTPSMVVAPTQTSGSDLDPELHTFREAIAVSGKSTLYSGRFASERIRRFI